MARMTPKMQEAAVRAGLADGKSLDEIRRSHGKDLADGIKAVEGAGASAPPRRGSGPRMSASSLEKKPTF